MSTTIQEHRLQPFCDVTSWRYALGSPWYINGKAFASNGKIAAWMPSEPFESAMNGKRPDATFIMNMEPKGLEYVPLPPLPPISPCRDCGGIGYTIEEECEECSGTGKIEHDCDCEYCTDTTEDCEACDGKGKFIGEGAKVKCDCQFPNFELLGMNFGLEQLHKIATLDGATIAGAIDADQLWFKCGDVAGVLMAKQNR